MKEKKITIKGVHLFPHQKDVAEQLSDWDKARGKTIVVKSSRQKGKSILISQALLKYAIGFGQVTKNFYVAPSLRQSRMMFEMIVKGVRNANIISKSNSTELTIEFINGSTIAFKSSEQPEASLRGWTCTGLLALDESSFLQDSVYYSLIQPWTQVHQAVTLMVSTPFTRTGFFYQHYIFGKEGTHNCVTIDWADEKYRESIANLLPEEKLNELRQMLPEKIFRNEYLGEFLDDDGIVFSLKQCFAENHILPNDKLFVGIDWSNQTAGDNDDTAVSIFNQDGKQVELFYFNNLPNQVDRIYSRIEPYISQIQVIVCETNSLGTPYTEQLMAKQRLGNKIKGFNTSNSSKNSLVVSFQTALEKGEVTLLPDEKQREQFGYFSCNFNPRTRTISYAAPEQTGLHDDLVMSTLFGWEAYKNAPLFGASSLIFKSAKYGYGKNRR